jgi:hypothetical protein
MLQVAVKLLMTKRPTEPAASGTKHQEAVLTQDQNEKSIPQKVTEQIAWPCKALLQVACVQPCVWLQIATAL